MTWKFEYEPESDETLVKWRDYKERFDGEITSKNGAYPDHQGANEAVNAVLQSINSVPEGLEATAEFRPGMIEYTTVENER